MSIKKNYLFTLLYQLLTMTLPLITVPYVSRVLKPEGVGQFAYTNSIVQYFVIFGMLGISIYGSKEIAINKNDSTKLSKVFFSIYSLQLLITSLSLLIYLLFVFSFFKELKYLALLQTFVLLSAIFDCTWLFFGLEQIKKVIIRNILVKILTLILILIVVKSPGDLFLYTLIMTFSIFFSQIIMWTQVKKFVKFTKINFSDIKKHFKNSIIYFIPEIAVQIYFLLDKTLLGLIANSYEVGVYDYSDKILKIALSVVTSLSIIMMPRMASVFANGDNKTARVYLEKSLDFSNFLTFGIMFGLIGISNNFIPWFLGVDFLKSIDIIIFLSPAVIFIGCSSILGSQYFVPLGKMKEYTISLYMGAFINVVINLLLISKYASIGAAIGTVAAECTVALIQFYYMNKKMKISIKLLMYNNCLYLISGIIMLACLIFIGREFSSSAVTTFIQIIIGVVIYFGFILLIEHVFDKNHLNNLSKLNVIKSMKNRFL